jgi:hypothetical protein
MATPPPVSDRRRAPRFAAAVPCTLSRAKGSAITAQTVDVGPGGLCVCSARPLSTDEVLTVDLDPTDDLHVFGRARVLRQQGHDTYALRFEGLAAPVREQLQALAAAAE